MKQSILTVVCAFVCIAQVVLAQQQKVTVMTSSGETIEGALTSADAQTIVVTVAGRALTFKQGEIKYISFVGKLEGSPAPTGVAPDPLSRAVSGLKAIGNAVSVGVLRTQYSQLLVENLPAVADFIKSPSDEWADVKLAMRQSASDYQEPMRSLDAWKYGEVNMTTGHQWATYAIDLAGRTEEQHHRETTEEHTIDGPSTVNGRLGVGDRQVDKSVDASSAGGFFDVYVIRLTAPAKLAIQMACTPCRPQLNVFDQSQKAVASNDGGIGKPAKIEKSLPAGTYTLFAGTFNGQVGNYSMSIKY